MKLPISERGTRLVMNPAASLHDSPEHSVVWQAHPWSDVGGVLLHDPQQFDEDILPLHDLPRFTDTHGNPPRKLLTTGGLSHIYDAGEYVVKTFDRPPDHQNLLYGSLPDLRVNVTLAKELERRQAHIGRWSIRNVQPVAAFLGLEAMTDCLSLPHPQGCPAAVWVLKKEAVIEEQPKLELPSPSLMAHETSRALEAYRYDCRRPADRSTDHTLVTKQPGFGWRKYGTAVLTGVFAGERRGTTVKN